MIFLFQTRRWCGFNLLIAATLRVVLLFSGCASQPQSITGETPTSTLRKELQHLESSKQDGQQLADNADNADNVGNADNVDNAGNAARRAKKT